MCKPCVITAILFLAIVLAGFLVLWNEARAESEEYMGLLISEILIYPTGERYIELYNPNDQPVHLTGWYIQRKTSSGDWGSLITSTYFEDKSINAHSHFLIAREGSPASENADMVIDSTMTMTADNSLRLRTPAFETMDLLGYGDASEYYGNSAPQPDAGKSLGRRTVESENDLYSNTGNNLDDFEIQDPTPGKTNISANRKEEPEENHEEIEEGPKEETKTQEEPQLSESPEKEEEKPKPSISIEYPREIYTDDEWFAVQLNVSDLPDSSYDVKISILDSSGKNISNIYNYEDKNFQTAFQYIQNAFYGTSFNGSFLKHISSSNLDYSGDVSIAAQIREHGKSSILLKTEGALLIKATETNEEADDISSEENDEKDNDDKFTKTNDIKITEFIPWPEGPDAEDEWIEIRNFGNKTYDLVGWQLAVTEGRSGPFTFPENTVINPGEYRVFWRPATRLALINSGDTLKLIYPDGNTAQKITYPKPPNGKSYALVDGEWTWTDNITPGYANLPPSESSSITTQDTSRATTGSNTTDAETGNENDKAERDTLSPEALSAQVGSTQKTGSFLYLAVAGIISLASGGAYLFIKRRAIKIE